MNEDEEEEESEDESFEDKGDEESEDSEDSEGGSGNDDNMVDEEMDKQELKALQKESGANVDVKGGRPKRKKN